jgi:hypothetical protein
MKQQAKNINDEAQAAARKELGGFAHPIYAVSERKLDPIAFEAAPPLVRDEGSVAPIFVGVRETPAMIYVEAARFIDARAFACCVLGCSEVDIARIEATNGCRPFPRWQVRYTGSAGGANPVTMQARLLEHAFSFQSDEAGWKNARDL